MKATAKDLRFHTREILEAVERGEEVIISYRGKEKARIVPLLEKHEGGGGNPLFGIWSDNKEVEDVEEYLDKLRHPRL
jgi:prevent-host-death family protein